MVTKRKNKAGETYLAKASFPCLISFLTAKLPQNNKTAPRFLQFINTGSAGSTLAFQYTRETTTFIFVFANDDFFTASVLNSIRIE
jgi:hypothetical protein